MSSLITRESNIEQKVTEYAVQKGCLHLKLNVMGRRGWPDHLYIFQGHVLFIEFKRQGEKPTKLQEHIHEQLRGHKCGVRVVDNLALGIDIIYNFTKDR